jgi:hypothetical protein
MIVLGTTIEDIVAYGLSFEGAVGRVTSERGLAVDFAVDARIGARVDAVVGFKPVLEVEEVGVTMLRPYVVADWADMDVGSEELFAGRDVFLVPGVTEEDNFIVDTFLALVGVDIVGLADEAFFGDPVGLERV